MILRNSPFLNILLPSAYGSGDDLLSRAFVQTSDNVKYFELLTNMAGLAWSYQLWKIKQGQPELVFGWEISKAQQSCDTTAGKFQTTLNASCLENTTGS